MKTLQKSFSKYSFLYLFCIIVYFLVSCKEHGKTFVDQPDETITGRRLILTPHIHNNLIVYSYHGELYITNLKDESGTMLRVNINEGYKLFPKFSPDGKKLLYMNRDGESVNLFVYFFDDKSIKQLTYNAGVEYPLDWSNDSRKILYSTNKEGLSLDVFTLFELDIYRGIPVPLKIEGSLACYDSIGNIYFNKFNPNEYRPGYRGGKTNEIYCRENDSIIQKIFSHKEQAVIYPMVSYTGDVFFLGDEGNHWNLYSRKTMNKCKSITSYAHNIYYPSISTDKKRIAYEYDGRLRYYNIEEDTICTVNIGYSEEPDDYYLYCSELNEDWKEVILSANDSDLFFLLDNRIFEGRIENNNVNVSEINWINTNKYNIRSISLSYDDRYFAYIENHYTTDSLVILDLKTKMVHKKINDNIFEENPLRWSPHQNQLVWHSKEKGLVLYDINKDSLRTIYHQTKEAIKDVRWSTSREQIVFSDKVDDVSKTFFIDLLRVYKIASKGDTIRYYNTFRILKSDSLRYKSDSIAVPYINSPFNERYPVLTCCGRNDLYVVINQPPMEGSVVHVVIHDKKYTIQKVVPLFKENANYSELRVKKNKLFFLHGHELKCFDIETKSLSLVKDSIISYDQFMGDKFLAYDINGNLYTVNSDSKKLNRLTINNPEVDRLFSWKDKYENVMNEVYRKCKDELVIKKMTNENWNKERNYYLTYSKYVCTDFENEMLIYRFIGSLNLSHFYLNSRFPLNQNTWEKSVTNTLGIDVFLDTISGKYIVGKIYKSDPYGYQYQTPTFLKEDHIKEGDTLVVINEQELSPTENFHKLVNYNGNWIGIRPKNKKNLPPGEYEDLLLMPKNGNLEYDEWVAKNTAYVDSVSSNKIGYISLMRLGNSVVQDWNHYLFKYKNYKKVIIDLRYCIGGSYDAYLLKDMANIYYGYTMDNKGDYQTRPQSFDNAELILLINEHTISAGELFALGFKALDLGKIIGVRTAGECLSNSPFFILDKELFIPTKAFYNKQKGLIENVGITPDIIVENTPTYFFTDCRYDNQLNRALEELK